MASTRTLVYKRKYQHSYDESQVNCHLKQSPWTKNKHKLILKVLFQNYVIQSKS